MAATLSQTRQRSKQKQQLSDRFNRADLKFASLEWIPECSMKKTINKCANHLMLLPVAYLFMLGGVSLQVMEKSQFMYPGHERGERTGCHLGIFGSQGIGKSSMDGAWTEILMLFRLMAEKHIADYGLEYDMNKLDLFIDAKRAKKVLQSVHERGNAGIAFWPEGGTLCLCLLCLIRICMCFCVFAVA